MSELEYTWNLEPRLKAINCGCELKKEILIFIENNQKYKGECSLIYRAKLHYIEDNINKLELIDEIRIINSKQSNGKC